jgi:hypothetical protein
MIIFLLRVKRLQVLGWGVLAGGGGDRSGLMIGGNDRVEGNHLPTSDLGDCCRNEEAYGRPVSVSMLQASLVLVEGIGLNIHEGTTWRLQLG